MHSSSFAGFLKAGSSARRATSALRKAARPRRLTATAAVPVPVAVEPANPGTAVFHESSKSVELAVPASANSETGARWSADSGETRLDLKDLEYVWERHAFVCQHSDASAVCGDALARLLLATTKQARSCQQQ